MRGPEPSLCLLITRQIGVTKSRS